MVSLWSKFKISNQRSKYVRFAKQSDDQIIMRQIIQHAKVLFLQIVFNTEIEEEQEDVSLWSKFKLSYKEGKLVKRLEYLLDNKMSHEDVKAYARIVLNINPGINWEEKLEIIMHLIGILKHKLDGNDDEEYTKDTEEEQEQEQEQEDEEEEEEEETDVDHKRLHKILSGNQIKLLGERVEMYYEQLKKIKEDHEKKKKDQEQEQEQEQQQEEQEQEEEEEADVDYKTLHKFMLGNVEMYDEQLKKIQEDQEKRKQEREQKQ